MRGRWLVSCCVTCMLMACASGESGAGEPFRVRAAQFFVGVLPGFIATSDEKREPLVTSLETANQNVFQGQGGKAFAGRTQADASSVAIALDGVGSGYWVVPTAAIDSATGELTFNFAADFDLSLRPGRYALRTVAVDDQGQGGDQLITNVCVGSRVPDNGSSCSVDAVPPASVISLQWDTNVDLDLQVVTPNGELLDAKHATATAADETAQLDRDSNAGCAIDGLRSENLVFNEAPEPGDYRVYVNMFDACKQPSVRFSVDAYTWETADDDDESLQRIRRVHRTGELLDSAAAPAAERGLFITKITFN